MLSSELQTIKTSISKHLENIFESMTQKFMKKINEKMAVMQSCLDFVESMVSRKIKELNSIQNSIKNMENILSILEQAINSNQSKTGAENSQNIAKFLKNKIVGNQKKSRQKSLTNCRSLSPNIFKEKIEPKNKNFSFLNAGKQKNTSQSEIRNMNEMKVYNHSSNISLKPDKSVLLYKNSLIQNKNVESSLICRNILKDQRQYQNNTNKQNKVPYLFSHR